MAVSQKMSSGNSYMRGFRSEKSLVERETDELQCLKKYKKLSFDAYQQFVMQAVTLLLIPFCFVQ